MDSDLERFEEELARLSPGKLPEGLISRMEAAMEGWSQGAEQLPENGGENGKVVLFPPRGAEGRPGRRSNLWAAAASVALLGAAAGFFFSAEPGRESASAADARAARESASLQPVEFAPQAAKRKILGASEERVIIANGAQPLRVMRLDYVDRMVFRNENGEEVHLEVPSVNYRLVPVVTD